MKEFVALRPKMYSFTYDKNDIEINERRCKGISRVVVKKELLHEHYKDTLDRFLFIYLDPIWIYISLESTTYLKFEKLQYVSSGFRCQVIAGSLMRLY